MMSKTRYVNGVKITVGDIFVNNNNGGQKVTILPVNTNETPGIIRYLPHDSFSSTTLALGFSHCDEDLFIKTFRRLEND